MNVYIIFHLFYHSFNEVRLEEFLQVCIKKQFIISLEYFILHLCHLFILPYFFNVCFLKYPNICFSSHFSFLVSWFPDSTSQQSCLLLPINYMATLLLFSFVLSTNYLIVNWTQSPVLTSFLWNSTLLKFFFAVHQNLEFKTWSMVINSFKFKDLI